jgi:hypothetical protein
MTGDQAKQPKVDDALFLSAAKSTLDDKIDRLDPQTSARLAQIRQQAIQAAADRTTTRNANMVRWLMPVGGGVAVAAAIMLAVTLGPDPALTPTPAQKPASMAVLEDINILTDSAEIEFYRDLEFYEWLAASEQNVS